MVFNAQIDMLTRNQTACLPRGFRNPTLRPKAPLEPKGVNLNIAPLNQGKHDGTIREKSENFVFALRLRAPTKCPPKIPTPTTQQRQSQRRKRTFAKKQEADHVACSKGDPQAGFNQLGSDLTGSTGYRDNSPKDISGEWSRCFDGLEPGSLEV